VTCRHGSRGGLAKAHSFPLRPKTGGLRICEPKAINRLASVTSGDAFVESLRAIYRSLQRRPRAGQSGRTGPTGRARFWFGLKWSRMYWVWEVGGGTKRPHKRDAFAITGGDSTLRRKRPRLTACCFWDQDNPTPDTVLRGVGVNTRPWGSVHRLRRAGSEPPPTGANVVKTPGVPP